MTRLYQVFLIEITGPRLEAIGATIVTYNDTLIAVGGSINDHQLHKLRCPEGHSN